MLSYSCRICSKIFCKDRGQVEGCKNCVSYVWLAMKKIDKLKK